MRRALAALVTVAASAALLSGCGSAASTDQPAMSPVAAVSRAVTGTQDAATARVRLTLTDGSRKAGLDGVVALDGSAADLTASLPASLVGGTGTIAVRQLVVDGTAYLKVAGVPLLPDTWLKVPGDKAGDGTSTDGPLSALVGGGIASRLDALRDVAAVEEVGSDEIDGVRTTHYRVTPDPTRAAGILGGLLGPRAKTGSTTELPPVDLWVDGSDRVVRMTQDVGALTGGTARWQLDLGDFGAPVQVTAPSGAVDLGGLLEGVGGISGLLGGLSSPSAAPQPGS